MVLSCLICLSNCTTIEKPEVRKNIPPDPVYRAYDFQLIEAGQEGVDLPQWLIDMIEGQPAPENIFWLTEADFKNLLFNIAADEGYIERLKKRIDPDYQS